MQRFKRILSLAARIIISVGLLIYVGTKIQFHDTAESPGLFSLIQQVKLTWFIPAFIMVFSIIWLQGLRWMILLRAQDIKLPYLQVFGLTYLGVFFNSFLPSALGGDIVKAGFVTQTTDRRTKAVLSILADRFTGFISLSLLCIMATLLMPVINPELENLKSMILIAAVIVLVILIIGFITLGRPVLRSPNGTKGEPGQSRINLFNRGIFREARETIQNYRDKLPQCFLALGITLIAHLIIIMVNVFYARALGITSIPLWYYFVFIPIMSFITSLPISVGGWGVGEMSYGYLLSFYGVPLTLAITLSLLFRISIALWSLPGAWFIIHTSAIKKNAESHPNDAQDQTYTKV